MVVLLVAIDAGRGKWVHASGWLFAALFWSNEREYLPFLSEVGFEGEPAVLISHRVEGGPPAFLVFKLDDLSLGRRHVRGVGDKNLARHPLLNGDTSA